MQIPKKVLVHLYQDEKRGTFVHCIAWFVVIQCLANICQNLQPFQKLHMGITQISDFTGKSNLP